MKINNKSMRAFAIFASVLMLTIVVGITVGDLLPVAQPAAVGTRNVIFFHPDGYGLNHWNALRFHQVGPDGRLNWDGLPHMAPYTGHMRDALTATSHGGATTHAYGVKVIANSFGMDGVRPLTALSGKNMSIMQESIAAGFATGLIQTGCLTEPGTAAFVASVERRDMRGEIARQVIESRVDVILGGGERFLLPMGVPGRHGIGGRMDGINLIERARHLGYTVVYTRDELMAAAANRTITRVLGVFAHDHTFNVVTGSPLYWPWAPTIAEMSAATLEILSRNPRAAQRGIFIVAEEEGTDDFGNIANAIGSFEAGRRADEAFRVFRQFVANNSNTLLITTADSSAGGKDTISPAPPHSTVFMSAPDRAGNRLQFAVVWAHLFEDVSGGIVARAKGLNAGRVTQLGVVDNTDIYRVMYYTLFNRWLPSPGGSTPIITPGSE